MRYFIANTKMNQTPEEAKLFIQEFLKKYKKRKGDTIVFCPSFIAIPIIAQIIAKSSIHLHQLVYIAVPIRDHLYYTHPEK